MQPAFLTDLECQGLCAQMDAAPQSEGGVREAERPETDQVDRAGRRAWDCDVSEVTVGATVTRICRVAPQIAAHFGEELAELEAPHFVVYEPGGFYRPHRDLYPDVAGPEPLTRRRISVVVFLNDRGETREGGSQPAVPPHGYAGGLLRVCPHESNDFESRVASEVPAAPGLLVAFRADTWHEVTPVTAGRRYTIVAQLLAPTG